MIASAIGGLLLSVAVAALLVNVRTCPDPNAALLTIAVALTGAGWLLK